MQKNELELFKIKIFIFFVELRFFTVILETSMLTGWQSCNRSKIFKPVRSSRSGRFTNFLDRLKPVETDQFLGSFSVSQRERLPKTPVFLFFCSCSIDPQEKTSSYSHLFVSCPKDENPMSLARKKKLCTWHLIVNLKILNFFTWILQKKQISLFKGWFNLKSGL